ncbi:hypothetical protein [Streptomyces sp. 142MFCol3.1]|uniref:hypothetical protein n=1 Tax=Streptomyces sp. 142MFCol3.1 TaxID=1172179 RepID=UPI0003F8AF2F
MVDPLPASGAGPATQVREAPADVVRADGDRTAGRAFDPRTMVTLARLDALQPVAEEAVRRRDAALAFLREPARDKDRDDAVVQGAREK